MYIVPDPPIFCSDIGPGRPGLGDEAFINNIIQHTDFERSELLTKISSQEVCVQPKLFSCENIGGTGLQPSRHL
jgi:hypothetical protein